MTVIDPTAIVDSEARLAEGVAVAPGCVIEGEVRIGPGTRLAEDVSLRGPLTIGQRNEIGPRVCLGYEPQDRKFDPETPGAGLVIGDGNVLEAGVTIHRATGEEPTRLGDRNVLRADSHVGHDARCGDGVTLHPEALVAGHVELQDGAVLEERTAVHQFCRVGRLSRINAGSVVSQDLPPFCVTVQMRRVGGLNTGGLEAAGLAEHIPALEAALTLLYRRGYTARHAVERIREELAEDPLCLELARFVETSQRGITGYLEASATGSPATHHSEEAT